MKHIIVPTDFSENAYLAAQFAISLTDQGRASMLIVHAYYPFKSGFQSQKSNDEDELRSRKEAEKEMERFIERLSFPESMLPPEVMCQPGNLLHLINDMGSSMENPIIVMGTTGSGGLKSFIGSNTLHIARNTMIPLIVVPAETKHLRIERAALFTDFKEEDKNTLSGLTSFFGKAGLSYNLIHISRAKEEDPLDMIQKLENWTRELQTFSGVEDLSYELAEGNDAIEKVNEITERKNIHLLALTMKESNFWDKLFEKNFAKSIILQSETPVFIQPKSYKKSNR